MELPNIGTAIGAIVNKVTQWIPSPKQAKLNQIDKLSRENAELQTHNPFTVLDSARYTTNADRIKQLREEVSRLD